MKETTSPPACTVERVCQYLEILAPLRLAEDWDNVGLLVGSPAAPVRRILTCLTVTPAVVSEAVAEDVQLVVTHHPFPFRPLKRITSDTTPGRMLLELIAHGIAVYSPHTAFDSALAGINRQLAELLELRQIHPLRPLADDPDGLGAGRCGALAAPRSAEKLARDLKYALGLSQVRFVGDPQQPVQRVATACGSAGEFLGDAHRHRCQLLITGETSFHTCLEAEALGIGLMLLGHYGSERFAVEWLAEQLLGEFPAVKIWPSRREIDPLIVL